MYTCSWRWVGRTAILCSLVGVLGCKAKEHPAEVEEELTLETIKGHRSEADLPHLHTPSKRQQALYQEAMTALQDGDEAQALHALQRLRQTETISALKRDGTLLYATLLETRGQRDAAIAVLDELIPEIPPSGDVFLVLARMQLAQGDTDEAERSLRDATRSAPELLRAWVALAQLLEKQNRHDESDDAMLHYEREVYRIGAQVEHGATLEQRLDAIAQFRVALPDPRISRILARALKNDAFDVQSAALNALEKVGTENAIEAIEAYRTNATSQALRERAAAVLEAIRDRHAR